MANSYPALAFNSGVAYVVDGDTPAPTPTNIRVLQQASIDMKASTKDLFGQNIFPVATGRSQIKVSGKLKFSDYQPRIIRDFIGAPNNSLMAAGQTLIQNAENNAATSSPVNVAKQGASFGIDLGVVYATTGIPLSAVSGVPTVGQYSSTVSGSYTLNASDLNLTGGLNFSYTYTSTGGDTVTMSQTSAGAANTFQTVIGGSYNGLQTNFQLYACIPVGLKLYDAKIGDFSMPELDFDAVVNAAGNLGIVSIPVTS